MILTTHAITGAAVASLFPNNPVLAFSLAFVSHFALDSIPHSQYRILSSSINPRGDGKIVLDKTLILDFVRFSTDGLFGILLSLFLFFNIQNFWIILGGALFGVFPDFLQFVYIKFRHQPLTALQYFHEWVHPKKHLENNSFIGISSQILIVLVIVFLTKIIQ